LSAKNNKALRRLHWEQNNEANRAFKMLMDCVNKTTFRAEGDAVNAIYTVLTKGERRSTRPDRAYRCKVCGDWHLTGSGNGTAGW
jgi:hypothetical protein